MTLEPSPQDRRTAAAMALALLRWHLLDFAVVRATVTLPDGSTARPVGYTPRFRFVVFERAGGERGRIARKPFLRGLWRRGAVHIHNFDEVTR